MKYLMTVVFCLSLFAHAQSQPFSCPRRSEDMLNYFVMAYPNRIDHNMGPGNANPIFSAIFPDYGNNSYAANGYFVWTKSSIGYPWDIKTFDANFIYDRTTELGWTDPTSFKRFSQDLPMSPRCLRSDDRGPTLKIPSTNTSYQSYSQCTPNQTQPLGYVMNAISAPTLVNVGNVGPVKTRYFTYKYSCDQNYANCQYMEVYGLGFGVGLFDWKYYVNKGGTFVLQQESVINQLHGGQTTPSLPCVSSYE